jgi:carbonic anhydrase
MYFHRNPGAFSGNFLRMKLNHRAMLVLLPTAGVAIACGSAPQPATPAPPPPPPPPAAAPTATAVSPAPTTPAPTATPKAEEHHAAHWTYAGDTGPSHWGDLSPEWGTCKTGESQSPIDLVSKQAAVDAKLKPLEFAYGKLPLSLFNNGHTIQIPNSAEHGVKVEGRAYKLAQFHLHSPSEHLVDGKPLDMELHLVHKDEAGKLLVVGLLFKKGKENKSLAEVFAHAPAEVTTEAKPIEKTELDLAQLLPRTRDYYTYAGSLTTPPCSEGVQWIVLRNLGEISDAQLEKFRDVTHGDTIRPAQPLGRRVVARSK